MEDESQGGREAELLSGLWKLGADGIVGEDNACSSLTLGRHQVLLDEYRALHTRKANY